MGNLCCGSLKVLRLNEHIQSTELFGISVETLRPPNNAMGTLNTCHQI